MKIYVAGPITNNPDYAQQFSEAEKHLTAKGHAVINPVKNDGFSYKEYIDMGLCELMRCDAIYLLPGWENSSGARLELHYALTVGFPIYKQRVSEPPCDPSLKCDTLPRADIINT